MGSFDVLGTIDTITWLYSFVRGQLHNARKNFVHQIKKNVKAVCRDFKKSPEFKNTLPKGAAH